MRKVEEPVRIVSKTKIKPQLISEESQQPLHLTPWDLAMLSVHYIQKGLLYPKPPVTASSSNNIIDELKTSLSHALTHFFPLAGRFVTRNQVQDHYHVFIDCSSDSPGAEFIHAVADHLTTADLMIESSADDEDHSVGVDVPPIFESLFFPLHEPVVNHDGHTIPLLIVQVTELVDGIFIGCSFNHVVGDGASYWNFFNTWSEISRLARTGGRSSTDQYQISHPPITKRSCIINNNNTKDIQSIVINLPFSHHDEFIDRFTPLEPLREKMFHFSAKSIATLKAKANTDCSTTNTISSFQALSALIWRTITRARGLPASQKIDCKLAINSRPRMRPPVPSNYFGNCIFALNTTATAGELLGNSLGWAARRLNEAVASHTDEKVREWLEEWKKKPTVYHLGQLFGGQIVMMGSSPRFDMYGNDFGWGKPLAVRSGYGNKFDGKVSSFPGREGGGSVDLEICLYPHHMKAFESDEELISALLL